MEQKIDLVELLKDCPKGMKLGSTLFNGLEFDHIDEHAQTYPIVCRILNQFGMYDTYVFTKYGCYNSQIYSKCVIFPKDKTSWEGFHRPFKDGDIVAFENSNRNHLQLFIFKNKNENDTLSSCYLMLDGDELVLGEDMYYATRLATKEEKEKLFNVIKENNYKWNSITKTLEKVRPKFKEKDIIVSIHGDIHLLRTKDSSYCAYREGWKSKLDPNLSTGVRAIRYATEEEKQKLFNAIETNGYKWTTETKTLDKLVKPKFKVGDKIVNDGYLVEIIEVDIEGEVYGYKSEVGGNGGLLFIDQDAWELADKFDVTTLKPFDKVLARCSSLEKWRIQFFEKFDKTCKFPFICMGYNKYTQCIPYEGNEHLLDTADSCSDYYRI